MELRTLRYFLAIAREETIIGAAKFLHVTQPTLSRQMKELEDELGKQLFIRGNRKIILTEEGMLLRHRGEEIVSLVDKTESEIMLSEENISGDIYIGGGETQAMSYIASAIQKCRSYYPNIRFHFFSGNAQDVSERLEKGLIDFGVVIEPADISKYEYIKLPTTDTWGLLMRKDDALAPSLSIKTNDLINLPLICSSQEMVKNEISGWLGERFENLQVVCTYNLLYNASILVENRIGYALCLDHIINTSGDSNLCFRPLEPKLEVGLTLVWKKYQIFSKASQLFLNILREEFRN